MAFVFRFQVLLDLRCRQRDEAGAEVGQANAAINKIDDEMKSVGEERHDLLAQSTQQSSQAKPSIDRLLQYGRYDLQLQGDLRSLVDTKNKLIVERDRRQAILRETEIEVKRLERLFENDRDAYLESQRYREQLEIDEAASRAYTVNQSAKIHFKSTFNTTSDGPVAGFSDSTRKDDPWA